MHRISYLFVVLTITVNVGQVSAQGAANSDSKNTAASMPAWRQKLIQQQQMLIAENGTGSNEVLKKEILEMWARFQTFHTAKPGEPITSEYANAARTANESLHQALRNIVAKYGWPTISMVGLEASDDALQLLINLHDTSLREELLPHLEESAKNHKIAGANVAALVDQDLVAKGNKQRYGTIFRVSVEDKTLTFINIEDPANLDIRRAEMGLPPIDEYKRSAADSMKMTVMNYYISPGASKVR